MLWPFFLFSAGRTDIPDPEIIGEYLLPKLVFDRFCEVSQTDISYLTAPAADQMIVPFGTVISIRRTRLGDTVQQALLCQGIQMLIHGANGDTGMLPFHLQKHLLRRGMLLQDRKSTRLNSSHKVQSRMPSSA